MSERLDRAWAAYNREIGIDGYDPRSQIHRGLRAEVENAVLEAARLKPTYSTCDVCGEEFFSSLLEMHKRGAHEARGFA